MKSLEEVKRVLREHKEEIRRKYGVMFIHVCLYVDILSGSLECFFKFFNFIFHIPIPNAIEYNMI